jgi:hypothetical protein
LQCFKQEGEKLAIILNAAQSTHYAAKIVFPSSHRRKRLPLSVTMQIILPAGCVGGVGFKHKPAKLNNHTIFCWKRIFPSEKRGQMKKKIETTRSYSFH